MPKKEEEIDFLHVEENFPVEAEKKSTASSPANQNHISGEGYRADPELLELQKEIAGSVPPSPHTPVSISASGLKSAADPRIKVKVSLGDFDTPGQKEKKQEESFSLKTPLSEIRSAPSRSIQKPLSPAPEKLTPSLSGEARFPLDPTSTRHFGPEDVEINLIQREKGVMHPRTIRLIAYGIFVFEFLVLLAMTLVVSAKASARSVAKTELESYILLEQRRAERYAPLVAEAANFQNKVNNIQAILDGRKDWLRLFRWLEENTLSNVYYSELSSGEDGKISLQVKAPGYQPAAQQMNIFLQSSEWTRIEISGLQIVEVQDGDVQEIAYEVSGVPTFLRGVKGKE